MIKLSLMYLIFFLLQKWKFISEVTLMVSFETDKVVAQVLFFYCGIIANKTSKVTKIYKLISNNAENNTEIYHVIWNLWIQFLLPIDLIIVGFGGDKIYKNILQAKSVTYYFYSLLFDQGSTAWFRGNAGQNF